MNIINLGNMITNNYLIDIDGKKILLDTSYPDGYKSFTRKLKKHKIDLSSIDYLVLTHAHDDHVGFANEILLNKTIKLIISKKSIERLALGHNKWIGGCSGRFAKFFVLIMGVLGKSKHEFPKVNVPGNAILFDGKNQPLLENNIALKIIELPGHTDDSIGLVYKNEALFCGDAAMNGFPSINRNIIWIENKDDYLKSWDLMIKEKVRFIYPSHGPRFLSSDLVKYRKSTEKIKIYTMKEPEYG